MPTPAVIPRCPFIPGTAQPPYSHVQNSTRAEVDRFGLTALRAMVDVEPYGSSDLGGDLSDDEPPSMTSASPFEDDDPEDPKNPSGKKKKKKRKTKRHEGCRPQEAKAIATSKIVANFPEFTGKDFSEFAQNFGQFLRMTSRTRASGPVKCDPLLQCCETKYLEKQVKQIVTKSATFADVLVALERQYPTYKTNLCIRAEIHNLAVLPNKPKPARTSKLLADLDHPVGRLTPGSYGSEELLFWLVAELPRELWDECRATAERKARALKYEDLSVLPLELALEKESDQHLNAYRPGGGGFGSQGRGYKGHGPGQATTPQKGHIIGNVQDLFWRDAGDEQGSLLHAPDCDQRDCFLSRGRSRRPTPAARPSCRTTTGAQSPVRSVVRGSTTSTSATTSNASRRSLRPRTPVARAVARAKPTRTVARASPRAMAKAKVAKAKVDDEALTASRTRTRTRTSLEGTPILRQGGTLIPLVGNQTPDLRPVRRRKPNKNKGLSVPTKIGPSLTPANAPVSCAWRGNYRRRGLKLPAPRISDRDAPGDLQIWCFW